MSLTRKPKLFILRLMSKSLLYAKLCFIPVFLGFFSFSFFCATLTGSVEGMRCVKRERERERERENGHSTKLNMPLLGFSQT